MTITITAFERSPECVEALREHTRKAQQRALERLTANLLAFEDAHA